MCGRGQPIELLAAWTPDMLNEFIFAQSAPIGGTGVNMPEKDNETTTIRRDGFVRISTYPLPSSGRESGPFIPPHKPTI